MIETSYQVILATKATLVVVGGAAIAHWFIPRLRCGGK